MDVRHLELLRELAERGSVTAVAAATHRTPSAVSQQLKSARRELGVPLVEPAGRGLRLTDAGQLLADGGRDIANTVAQVEARWDQFRGVATGFVDVAALPSAATFLLPGVLARLADDPIEIRCTDIDIAEAAFAGLVVDHDIVIAHSVTSRAPAGTDGLVTVRLVREPLDVAMAADHPLAKADAVTAADLADQEWIGVPTGYPFDAVLQAIARKSRTELTVTQRLRDNRLIEAIVGASHQVAILPRFTTARSDRLVLRPLRGIRSGRYVFAVLRPDRAERIVVRRVLESSSPSPVSAGTPEGRDA